MSVKNEHGLTPPQEKFAQLVGGGKPAAEAYREAYPKSVKWKDEAVRVNASKLLADANVSLRVSQIQQAGARLAELDAAEVASEIKRVAFSDIAGIVKVVGGKTVIRLPNELDAATRAAVASFEIDEFGRIKYKFWDKNSALDKAAKILGMYEKDNKQKSDPLVELIKGLGGNVIGVAGGEPSTASKGE